MMKKIVPVKALLLIVLVVFTSCTKDNPEIQTVTETIRDTIVLTETDTVFITETDSLVRGPHRGYINGIITRDFKNFKNVKESVKDKISGFVLHLTWKDAQQIAKGPIHEDAKAILDEAELEAIANGYDQIRLRFFAGKDSPDWAKNLGSGPMTWGDPTDGGDWTIPVWFHDEFLDAYDDVISKLADELSTRPLFKEVTCSGASTVYAEPCIRQFGNEDNRAIALSKGYSVETDVAAFKKVIDIHHQYMSPLGIVSSVAYNPFQYLDEDGNLGDDKWGYTKELMDYHANLMQEYCIWDNHSLGVNVDGKQVRGLEYNLMYTYMALHSARNLPNVYQTMTFAKMTNGVNNATPYNTIKYVVDNLGLSVEMPSGWESADPELLVTRQQADTFNSMLKMRADSLYANPFRGAAGF